MTTEEAILYLSPIAESASLKRYKEALGMAIAALRAQQERENPQPLTRQELHDLCSAGNAHVWVDFSNGRVLPALAQEVDGEVYAVLGSNWVIMMPWDNEKRRFCAYRNKPEERRMQHERTIQEQSLHGSSGIRRL